MRDGEPLGDGRGGGGRHGTRSTAATRRGQDDASDVDIVLRMRTGDAAAFDAFVERFHPVLLDYARRAGVRGSKRDELVSDVLTDVALDLLTPGKPAPRNPRVYLIVAFRNRVFNYDRSLTRRQRHLTTLVRDAALDSDYADEGEVVAGCSEQAVRESRGPWGDDPAIPPALERLSIHLGEALSGDERLLLVAVAENIPQREVAEWLGVSHAAARKKLERLRGRLMDVASRYTNTLAPDDAREVQRFFQRLRVRIGAHASVLDSERRSDIRGRTEPDEPDTKGNAR